MFIRTDWIQLAIISATVAKQIHCRWRLHLPCQVFFSARVRLALAGCWRLPCLRVCSHSITKYPVWKVLSYLIWGNTREGIDQEIWRLDQTRAGCGLVAGAFLSSAAWGTLGGRWFELQCTSDGIAPYRNCPIIHSQVFLFNSNTAGRLSKKTLQILMPTI